ncbi:antibiotic biosynthesis monooxygenase family protein (plasmid) [Pseudoalteromonas sp. T1lg65]|uniref:antibiotic biosynthesis monooxygenase family protein n=1 Tax=Pseudoalteromonas sp. T1lg65 TaxID=2077101 RepID=UPI003F791EA1
MYAVIFKAKPGKQDSGYNEMVKRMRELAFDKYGCIDFIAASDDEYEVTISYWEDEEAIKRWKSDPEHALAQQRGREKWYTSYSVQILEMKRQYSFES